MGEALIAAAAEAGHPHHPPRHRLPLRRLRRRPPDAGTSSASPTAPPSAWAERVVRCSRTATTRGSARPIHSVRAVPAGQLATVARWAEERAAPAARPPVRADRRERRLPGRPRPHPHPAARRPRRARPAHHRRPHHPPHRRGHRPARRLRPPAPACAPPPNATSPTASARPPRCSARARPLSLGSDSHAVIDLLEEARAMELNERLRTRTRGHWTAAALLRAATADGHAALGWPDAGAPGDRARSPTSPPSPWTRSGQRGRCPGSAPRRPYSPRRPRTSGTRSSAAGTSYGTGRTRSSRTCPEPSPRPSRPCAADAEPPAERRGPRAPDEPPRRHAPRTRRPPTIDDHAPSSPTSPAWSPTTPPSATDPLGLIQDAAVVIDGDRVAWVGESSKAPATDNARRRGGRAVIPGFVDSHSHLVFAGDRTAGVQRPHVRPPLHRGRHPHHRRRHPRRRATTSWSANLARYLAEALPPGHHHLRDQVRLRPHRRRRGPRPAHRRRATPTRSPTSAPTSSPPSTPTTPPPTSTSSPATMLDACAPYARWIDVFCEKGAFDGDQARAILTAGRGAGA